MTPPPPRPLRQRFRDAARTEILEAAERVFVRDGLSGARIDAIAAEAGVSVGTIYNLFNDRGGVVEALIAWRHGEMFDTLDAVFAAADSQPFPETLSALVTAMLAHFRARWDFLRVVKQAEFSPDGQACGHGPRKSREAFRDVHARHVALMQRGIDEGHLRDMPAEQAAAALVGLLRAAIEFPLLLDRPALEATPEQILDLFLNGAARR